MFVDGKQMHIALQKGDVGRYVIVPGDPGRCEKIAKYFDDAQFVASNREFTTWTGTLLGEKVSVCSTGIGGPSTAIAIEELVEKTGVKRGNIVVIGCSTRFQQSAKDSATAAPITGRHTGSTIWK